MRSILFAAIVAVALPSSAFAQSSASDASPTCDVSEDVFDVTKELFVGVWEVTVLQGTLKGPGMIVPLPPPKEKDSVTLFMDGDQLMAKNPAI